MEPTEVSPSLKPKKHSWYAACFLVLFLTIAVGFAQALLSHSFPADPVQRLDYAAELFGSALGAAIVYIPALIVVLAFLFIFDGWISKAIVGVILTCWLLFQAVDLGSMVRKKFVTEESNPSQKLEEASSHPKASPSEVQPRAIQAPRARVKHSN
jgi:hypothetical protein